MLDFEGTFQIQLKSQPNSLRCRALGNGRLMAYTSVAFNGESISTRWPSRHVRVQHMAYTDGNLDVSLKVSGWGIDGRFGDAMSLELEIFEETYQVSLDTSCSAPIQLPATYPAAPQGTFTLQGGNGDCLEKMPTTTGVETMTWGRVKHFYD